MAEGIVPRRLLFTSRTPVTRLLEHVTPNHVHGLPEPSQLAFVVQLAPPVAVYSATSALRSPVETVVPAITTDGTTLRDGERDATVVGSGWTSPQGVSGSGDADGLAPSGGDAVGVVDAAMPHGSLEGVGTAMLRDGAGVRVPVGVTDVEGVSLELGDVDRDTERVVDKLGDGEADGVGQFWP